MCLEVHPLVLYHFCFGGEVFLVWLTVPILLYFVFLSPRCILVIYFFAHAGFWFFIVLFLFKWSIVLLQFFLPISVIRILSCRGWTFSLSSFTYMILFFLSLFIFLISAIRILIICQLTFKKLKTCYIVDNTVLSNTNAL